MLAENLAILLVYFALTFVATVWLGYLQTPTGEAEQGGYAIAAIIALCVQALVSVLFLGWTGWFPAAAVWLAFTLLCHHAMIHRNSRFEGEQCSCAPFQFKDIGNHETWVVAALVAGLISLLRV
jgi:hypothetical protein